DASLAKHKALELEIKRLLKAVVSQDIISIVQNASVVDTSDLRTKLEHPQNPLSQKLENENVELEFQVLNYARENAHLKATYKNLFDSIYVSRAQTQTIIASLKNELQSNIYKNAKLRTQLFKKVSDQKDNTQDTSKNTKFAKQPIVENLPKISKTIALSKPVTSNSVSTPQESKGMNNDKNDREDAGKLGAKGDIGFFIGYSADSCAYRVYNRRSKKIMETMNVSFDELSAMAFEQRSSKPGLQCITSGQISSGLDLTYAPSTITKQQPTEGELDLLFEAMYDDYFGGQPSASVRQRHLHQLQTTFQF
nr:integrase, catalytic region, zinc finger, CCHC-type, peptidase aspartic, catalytic [Tanacetum cinerariifolium]